jgi:hypothetical protein
LGKNISQAGALECSIVNSIATTLFLWIMDFQHSAHALYFPIQINQLLFDLITTKPHLHNCSRSKHLNSYELYMVMKPIRACRDFEGWRIFSWRSPRQCSI